MLLEGLGECLSYALKEGKGGLVVPYFFDNVLDVIFVHGCEILNCEHILWDSGVKGGSAKGNRC
jgi:hypothetical protein